MAKFLALFFAFPPDFIKKKNSGRKSEQKSSFFYQALANWAYQSPAQAGFAFQEFGEEFIYKNKLVNAELIMQDRQVDLKNITQPV